MNAGLQCLINTVIQSNVGNIDVEDLIWGSFDHTVAAIELLPLAFNRRAVRGMQLRPPYRPVCGFPSENVERSL